MAIYGHVSLRTSCLGLPESSTAFIFHSFTLPSVSMPKMGALAESISLFKSFATLVNSSSACPNREINHSNRVPNQEINRSNNIHLRQNNIHLRQAGRQQAVEAHLFAIRDVLSHPHHPNNVPKNIPPRGGVQENLHPKIDD
jgi:hypothetical protein